MSRLTDLLTRLRLENASLATDLEKEITALSERRAFGLNFERHVPEAVELPGRKVRKGDKVRILPPRGEVPKASDDRLWKVLSTDRSNGTAALEALETTVGEGGQPTLETAEAAVDDLVVVAEFRDPIYPGLISTGKVERGGDKPFHTVINAENYHALQTLLFTHRGKVDCIYIDPPYNTRDKDWKYNNDYVNSDDLYRHSKWLAMMERRLLLAKELLNPDDSVLIVTIDEKEYLRLGMLIEQTFPEGTIQMVTSVINPGGSTRAGAFSRTDEYLYFVSFGSASATYWEHDMLSMADADTPPPVQWHSLVRHQASGFRTARPNLFYPIYVDVKSGQIVQIGDALPAGSPRESVVQIEGAIPVFPVYQNGGEGTWSLSPPALRTAHERGFVRVGTPDPAAGRCAIYYLKGGKQKQIESGEIRVTGHDSKGAVVVEYASAKIRAPRTTWNMPSHNARSGGSDLLRAVLGGRNFPFPKSLYAVEDALRFFVADKPDAVVLDFFCGSGTTAHAVLRLNKQDGGRRQAILITNNEVGAEEQRKLRDKDLRPGDSEWERWGICEYITKPRIAAAVTGRTPERDPINGDYKFTDEFPMADGFEENVEFLTLTYEAPLRVASHREFAKIAPLLWMRAGSRGRRIDDISNGWDVADVYGVLADLDQTEGFLKAVAARGDHFTIAFVVTDEDRLFESVARELPDHVEPVRLYESYLRNFEIESGRGML